MSFSFYVQTTKAPTLRAIATERTGCSRADYELGLRLVEVVAKLTGGLVTPEDGDAMPAARLRDDYGDAWMDRMVPWGADIMMTMVDRDQQTITFWGARREVHPGGGAVQIAWAHGRELAGDKWEFLDEKNALVAATSDAEWPAFIERAKAFALRE